MHAVEVRMNAGNSRDETHSRLQMLLFCILYEEDLKKRTCGQICFELKISNIYDNY